MNIRKIWMITIIIFLLVTLIFIFSNSLLPVAESRTKSLMVMERIKPLFELFVGKGNVTDHIVRKTAHFCEYTVLGMSLMLVATIRLRTRFQNVANCLSLGLFVAVIDESLQMLTDRGPMVKDVLLDFTGVLTGVLLVILIHTITRFTKKYLKNRP